MMVNIIFMDKIHFKNFIKDQTQKKSVKPIKSMLKYD